LANSYRRKLEMSGWNRRDFMGAALLGAAWLVFTVGVAGGPSGDGFISPAHAEFAPIRRLIEWLRGSTVPSGIVKLEGRIDAAEIDVSPQYPGTIAEVMVSEGERVAPGQAVARIESRELEADLQAAEAKLKSATEARAQDAIRAAETRVNQVKAMIGALTLTSPRAGRVKAQLAHAGDTIVASAPVVTLIDLSDVYMTVFVPAAGAARLRLGDEARLILDAAPDSVVPATVSFVASAPPPPSRAAETKEGRAKELFRVDLKVDPKVLETYSAKVETGLRGAGFVRTNPDAKWPADLQVKLPPAPVEPAPVGQETATPATHTSGPAAVASAPPAAPVAKAVAPPQDVVQSAPTVSVPSTPAPTPQASAPASAAAVGEVAPVSPPPPVGVPTSPPAPAQPPSASPASMAGLGPEEPAAKAAESLAQLSGAWAQSADDCKRLFQRRGGALSFREPVDEFAQAMIIDARQIRLPTGVCRLERTSREGSALRMRGECEDSISYTSQTTYVKLRSRNEIAFNPNGDPALDTSLMRCPVSAEAAPQRASSSRSGRPRRKAP
jgi:HlyD family secretion protein